MVAAAQSLIVALCKAAVFKLELERSTLARLDYCLGNNAGILVSVSAYLHSHLGYFGPRPNLSIIELYDPHEMCGVQCVVLKIFF